MKLFEAIEKRASVRQYVPVEIPQADIDKILEAARRAPSGKNVQPVQYVVVRSKETLEKLSRAQGCIAQASAAIAVVADPQQSVYWLEDASAATTQMLLAIEALGYASVWIEGTLKPHEDYAKELLGVPAGLRLVMILPIGKASAPVGQKPKKSLSEIVHWDRW